MRKPGKSRRYAAAAAAPKRAADEARRELALLEEFTRCDSVARARRRDRRAARREGALGGPDRGRRPRRATAATV